MRAVFVALALALAAVAMASFEAKHTFVLTFDNTKQADVEPKINSTLVALNINVNEVKVAYNTVVPTAAPGNATTAPANKSAVMVGEMLLEEEAVAENGKVTVTLTPLSKDAQDKLATAYKNGKLKSLSGASAVEEQKTHQKDDDDKKNTTIIIIIVVVVVVVIIAVIAGVVAYKKSQDNAIGEGTTYSRV